MLPTAQVKQSESIGRDESAERSLPPTLNTVLASMQTRLFAIAFSATGQREDALDLVQIAMEKLVAHYAQRPAQEWKPLLLTILGNAITDHYRRTARHRKVFAESSQNSEFDGLEAIASDTLSGADQLAAERFNRQLVMALGELPERQRQVFLLRGWGELSIAESAAAMDCSIGTVKQHYFRALRALRALFEQNNIDATLLRSQSE